ncbi:uncharacterized protein [Dermacentor albipictus]|uniref:uncharacterized protein n=1 Tax=Dermacentor albipictus TaxID=60249 RepID=UPI0031FD0892
MEKALQQRARQNNRDAVISRELSAVTLCNDVGALRELIRAVVKEELQKMQTTTAPELKFLGHVVSSQGVRPDPEKLTAIAEFPRPKDKKSAQWFLGLCAYCRRFVQGFSRIAEPLTRLTRQDVPFAWTEEQE